MLHETAAASEPPKRLCGLAAIHSAARRFRLADRLLADAVAPLETRARLKGTGDTAGT